MKKLLVKRLVKYYNLISGPVSDIHPQYVLCALIKKKFQFDIAKQFMIKQTKKNRESYEYTIQCTFTV